MFRLICSVKNYEWGKIGEESEVYKLVKSSKSVSDLDPSLPFAELWMGTHISGQSYIAGLENTTLAQYVSTNVESIGVESKEKFGRTLPFLLKVLSVRKALSIQAHPTKKHAVELNEQRPDLYKDANHKPEMAIALTPFEALVGFRHPKEIAAFVNGIPELREVVGPEASSDLCVAATGTEDLVEPAIKEAYSKLMCTDETKIASSVNQLRDRLLDGERFSISLPADCNIDMKTVSELFIRLSTEFPGDVGCFSLFFLNYLCLEPGEAIFLEANLPHAYLSGDCVECMACSDNVVRAGLTPKFKDVECLLSMLLYEPRSINELKFVGEKRSIEYLQTSLEQHFPSGKDPQKHREEKGPEIISFTPLVEDFAVDKITIPSNCHGFELVSLRSASILLFIRGSGYLQRVPVSYRGQQSQYSIPEQQSLKSADDSDPTGRSDGPEELHKGDADRTAHAGRVHETLEFTRGSVFFIGANVSCFIHQKYMTLPAEDSAAAADSCLAFRAYVNVDS